MPDERRNEPQTSGASRYQIHQKLVALGDDFWIENEQGQKVFRVDGKALRLRKTLIFEDAHGKQLCRIQERLLTIQNSMEIVGAHGEPLALVKKAMLTPLRERYTVKLASGAALDIQGNILDHEYIIASRGDKVAEVSKKWLSVRDSYSVAIEPGQDEYLILAVVVCIDQLAHRGR